MMQKIKEFPFEILISFHKVIDQYNEELKHIDRKISRDYMESIVAYIKDYPQLIEGFSDPKLLKKYEEPISILLDDLFPNVLTNNEIKAASVPFQNIIFNSSKRFSSILKSAGEKFELVMRDVEDETLYKYACIQILKYYGFDVDISRPLYYDIPDENGIVKHYRIAMNADFIEIIPKKSAKKITQKDVDNLIENVDDIELWKQKIPPKSYVFKGFGIINLTDVTIDEAISELKTTLLFDETNEYEELQKMQEIFRSIYKIPELSVGFTMFNKQEMVFEKSLNKDAYSFILDEELVNDCQTGICEEGFKKLVEENDYFVIPNVDIYLKKHNNLLARNLAKHDIKSCLLAPIAKNGRLFGVLELASKKKNELNAINAIKLEDILPYLVTTLERNTSDYENRIKAVIQSECTSIHPSVLWVFEKEAKKFIRDLDSDGFASFKDITFKDVYPLYGQIDIVASSEARNDAIKQDLIDQLDIILEIIDKAYKKEKLSIYEQVRYRISDFKEEVSDNLNASSEQEVFNLLQTEVNPLMEHLEKQSGDIMKLVDEYKSKINPETGIVYNHRKKYDDTVQMINRTMSRYIDKKQHQAQEIYPHYFERYKTDGVDHNMYIGASMANKKPFNKVYLFNLRLWQMSTMCEMENRFYQLQETTPVKLEAASLILVYNNTMSIRYRMDEKKFDVDGTYNARYEIIKKRIDKAYIKDTEERATQKGFLTIVYSQKEDEEEYLQYVKYLQAKKYVDVDVEVFQLEDVQGVVGLKAMRVKILYTLDKGHPEKTFTYEDLVAELN
ncbi:GAF domain-containing protein [Gramella sp. AN32]|uniref:GAF domain-containing protein n=1 Tax=Christiangramia antarctica TaxID=2058158 RepID=A0ABW5X2B7_9FLAO|nr:GAF domain-containing protein [Gramella sp. AN32]MCM4157138.1 GAF domain-containing protein [Gramella sp. AN32]